MPPDSKDAKLGSCDQEASASVGKNTVAMLILCYTWNYVSVATSSGIRFVSHEPTNYFCDF